MIAVVPTKNSKNQITEEEPSDFLYVASSGKKSKSSQLKQLIVAVYPGNQQILKVYVRLLQKIAQNWPVEPKSSCKSQPLFDLTVGFLDPRGSRAETCWDGKTPQENK